MKLVNIRNGKHFREVFWMNPNGTCGDKALSSFQHRSLCMIFNITRRGADARLIRGIIFEPSVEQNTE